MKISSYNIDYDTPIIGMRNRFELGLTQSKYPLFTTYPLCQV